MTHLPRAGRASTGPRPYPEELETMTVRTAAAPAAVGEHTPSRNVRVGAAWDDAKTRTRADGMTIADVVRAALGDYLEHRARGEWPTWLPRPATTSTARPEREA